jgi:hypothetical protein
MIRFNSPSKPATARLLLSAREAADSLGVSDRALQEYTNRGLLACVRLPSTGKKGGPSERRYAVEELENFIQRHSTDVDSDSKDLMRAGQAG